MVSAIIFSVVKNLSQGVRCRGHTFSRKAQALKRLCSWNRNLFKTTSGAFLFGTSHIGILFYLVLMFRLCSLPFSTPVHLKRLTCSFHSLFSHRPLTKLEYPQQHSSFAVSITKAVWLTRYRGVFHEERDFIVPACAITLIGTDH